MKNGIDISKHQGKIDWAKLAARHKAGKLDFVIMRAGYGRGVLDPRFEENYAAASAAGIPVGAYWYAYWLATPRAEAESFLSAIQGKILQCGIWYDVEYEPAITSISKTARTDKTLEALNTLAASGRYVGLYASTDMINNRMDYDRLRGYDLWVAQYGAKCTCKLPYGMWQYTSNGQIDGIAGRVDCDIAYKDYPSIVTGALAGGVSKPALGSTGADKEMLRPAEDAAYTPCEMFTRRYGTMTRGDLVTLMNEADKLGVAVMGELTLGPASTGDDKVLRARADALGIAHVKL